MDEAMSPVLPEMSGGTRSLVHYDEPRIKSGLAPDLLTDLLKPLLQVRKLPGTRTDLSGTQEHSRIYGLSRPMKFSQHAA